MISKKLVSAAILATALVCGNAYAHPKTLECTSGSDFKNFSVTLDDTHFDAGSGLFSPENAHFIDNYLSLENLTCSGNTLKELECVGFAFGISSYINEVSLIQIDGTFAATLRTLKGPKMAMHDGPWPCREK
ncbi:MAG: hypothetical protein ACXWPM_02190 [Bdellovibrionota bacterium]